MPLVTPFGAGRPTGLTGTLQPRGTVPPERSADAFSGGRLDGTQPVCARARRAPIGAHSQAT